MWPKLEHYGIRGVANDWSSSYLSIRQQYAKIGNKNSHTEPILQGVPQGSILGHLLFLTYINDLNKCTLREEIFAGRKFREFREFWPNSRK